MLESKVLGHRAPRGGVILNGREGAATGHARLHRTPICIDTALRYRASKSTKFVDNSVLYPKITAKICNIKSFKIIDKNLKKIKSLQSIKHMQKLHNRFST